MASTMTPNSAEIARSERVRPPRHGRFHARRTSAPVRTRHHATDAGSTEAKATTASAAPTYWMRPEPTMYSWGGMRSATKARSGAEGRSLTKRARR